MTFSTLGLSDALLRAVADQGYRIPTPIQAQAIPAVLAGGDAIQDSDLRLPAETGDTTAARADGEPKRTFSAAKREAVVDFECSYLLSALRANGGNVSRTAAAIGMVRQSLQQKIRELGLRGELELEGLRDADDE